MPAHAILAPKPLRPQDPDTPALSEADIDRFATLFSPATPPATPTLTSKEEPPPVRPAARSRGTTQGSSDSEFGAFVSVPPSQDPLTHDADRTAQPRRVSSGPGNHSLIYFDQFTASAKTAADRQKREVLDELLQHQDDPMYFLDTRCTAALDPDPTPLSTASPHPMSISVPLSTDDALAEALASEMAHPKLVRVERRGSIRVAPTSPSRSRLPLPPRLSGSASPPSRSSPTGSTTSLPPSSPPLGASTPTLAGTYPAHATLSRLSSSLVSLLPSGRPRSTAPAPPTAGSSSSAPNTIARFHGFSSPALTHGSPFSATPYIPPTGAPGFAGDRAWDRGFSDALEQEEKLGLVDPVGLGIGGGTGTEMTAHAGRGKGVILVGRREGTAKVSIRPHLPALTKLPRHWTLLYSLDQHGISLNTLYSRCEPRVPSRAHPNPPKGGLLVLKDAGDAVFGAWLSEGVRLEKGGYYGSGESFLWRYHSPVVGGRQGRLDVYAWTGVNEYVALCEPGFISFGGGCVSLHSRCFWGDGTHSRRRSRDGHYGLYLDASLLDGSSAACPTFGNPPLCAAVPHASAERNGVVRAKADVSFECVGLEVWGIGSG
ncbi:TLD-domain-containing protein [Boletus coccyginus]|nr:TLD-domain-containing protein [Boletus coccyginus]